MRVGGRGCPALAPPLPPIQEAHHGLGNFLRERGRLEEAEVEMRTVISAREKTLEPNHPELARSRMALAYLLVGDGRFADALAPAERAWNRYRQPDMEPLALANSATGLAEILWEVAPPERDRTRARRLAEDALQAYREGGTPLDLEDAKDVQQWLDEHPLP